MKQVTRPVPGQRYRHFKGNLYQIITIGYHSETDEAMVVYQALYGDFKVYIRSLQMFQEPVDKVKYPEVEQEYRFQLVIVQEGDRNATSMEKWEDEKGEISESAGTEYARVPEVDPLLIRFLDAETYGEKLKIFLDMRENISEIVLTDVAASMDISTGTGTLEEQYANVEFALQTLARYERNN